MVPPTHERVETDVAVFGGDAGRFSAFNPDWRRRSTPVLRAVHDADVGSAEDCADGLCRF